MYYLHKDIGSAYVIVETGAVVLPNVILNLKSVEEEIKITLIHSSHLVYIVPGKS